MEDPELKNLLRENNRLEEENSRMLRSLYRSNRWSTVFSLIKWIVLIGAGIGLFYYLKPIFDSLSSSYQYITGHPLPSFFSTFFNK